MLYRSSVQSTQIKTIGYNTNTKELFIEYKNNAIYKYINVQETVYNGILTAKSASKRNELRGNEYLLRHARY